MQKSAEDIDMQGGDVAKSATLKKPLSDFGAMGALLNKIEAKTEK